MRSLVCVLSLIFAVAPIAQERDAAVVLKEMRQALGGDAALDAVKTFSMNGTLTLRTPGGPHPLNFEWFAVLPGSFLEIRRDSGSGGPIAYDITYYKGVHGDAAIRKTDARGMPMPPEPFNDVSPATVAQRQRENVLRNRQSFARLCTVLLGGSPTAYPLTFTLAAQERAEGRTFDVLEASGPDGPVARFHIDSATHLPAMITWKAERVFTMTTTSTVAIRGGEVVSRTPEVPVTVRPPDKWEVADWRWILSDYKHQHGLNWPRRIEVLIPGSHSEEIRIRGIKINPKIEARRFDIK